MSSSRSTFLSGTIFGIVLGVILGHVSIWKNVRTHSDPVSQTFPAKEIAPNGMPFDLGEKGALPYYPEEPLRPVDEPLTGAGENIAAESPLANAIAVETVEVTDTASVVSDETVEEIVSVPALPIEEPNPLDIEQAAPIETAPGKNLDAVRKAIDEELSEIPVAQRDVWFESLKDMHVDDATGVIRMWKMIGGPIPGLGDESLFLSPSSPPKNVLPQPVSVAETNSGLKKALQEAIAIHQRNALMESTLGYIRIVPRFTEEIIDGKPTISGVVEEFDLSPADGFVPGSQLDVMIKGSGMFKVQDEDGQIYLTRRGRFAVNQDRKLAVIDPDAEYILQPEVTIPESTTRIVIESDGQVKVNHLEEDGKLISAGSILLTPTVTFNELSYYKNGLLKVRPEFDSTSSSPESNGLGYLVQGFLGVSNVKVVNENQEIARLKEMLSEL